MHKEKEQLSLDESSCRISLTESDLNNIKEKYDCQESLDIELFSDESCLDE